MSRLSRFALAVSMTLVAALAWGSAAASAATNPLLEPRTAFEGDLAAPAGTYTAACHRAYRPGRAGVATRSVDVSGPGSVTVELAGENSDWDVAVFDSSGRVIAADASPDAQEIASGFALAAGTVRVQACRRSGDAAVVPASLEHAALRPGAADGKIEPPKMVASSRRRAPRRTSSPRSAST